MFGFLVLVFFGGMGVLILFVLWSMILFGSKTMKLYSFKYHWIMWECVIFMLKNLAQKNVIDLLYMFYRVCMTDCNHAVSKGFAVVSQSVSQSIY